MQLKFLLVSIKHNIDHKTIRFGSAKSAVNQGLSIVKQEPDIKNVPLN